MFVKRLHGTRAVAGRIRGHERLLFYRVLISFRDNVCSGRRVCVCVIYSRAFVSYVTQYLNSAIEKKQKKTVRVKKKQRLTNFARRRAELVTPVGGFYNAIFSPLRYCYRSDAGRTVTANAVTGCPAASGPERNGVGRVGRESPPESGRCRHLFFFSFTRISTSPPPQVKIRPGPTPELEFRRSDDLGQRF